jgi:hypothetical protein
VVVWIHGGGYEYHVRVIAPHPLTDVPQDTCQEVLILKRTLSRIRRTEPSQSLFSIALVHLVESVQCSSSLFIDNLEGFLAGPSVKKRGALNAGLRMYPYRLLGKTFSI